MPNKCAYCEKETKLTKEHVMPKGILDRMPGLTLQYLGAAKKVLHNTEFTIKDVCGPCNNGVLSDLDAHAVSQFEQYFHQSLEKPTTLVYDYNLLSRWLLKVSYNSGPNEA